MKAVSNRMELVSQSGTSFIIVTKKRKTFLLDGVSSTSLSTSEMFYVSATIWMHLPGPSAWSSVVGSSEFLVVQDET